MTAVSGEAYGKLKAPNANSSPPTYMGQAAGEMRTPDHGVEIEGRWKMRAVIGTIKISLLAAWAVCCVFLGIRDGFDYGAVYFLFGLVMAMLLKRMMFGPRDLSYGYKNGYRPVNSHEDWRGTGPYEPTEIFEKDWYK